MSLALQICSDLHLEKIETLHYETYIIPTAPNLCLLGDICQIDKPRKLFPFLEWCCRKFDRVFWVYGNHEFYVMDEPRPDRAMNTLKYFVERWISEKKHDNLAILDNKSVVVQGVKLIGSTLWSNVPTNREAWITWHINDYQNIGVMEGKVARRLQVRDTNDYHQQSVEFIRNEINDCAERGLKAVVLTHHAPLFGESTAPQYRGNKNRWAFCSDQASLFGDPLGVRSHAPLLSLRTKRHYYCQQCTGIRCTMGLRSRPELQDLTLCQSDINTLLNDDLDKKKHDRSFRSPRK